MKISTRSLCFFCNHHFIAKYW